MNENTENKVRFVPAICSHCGGSLDVDPSQEAAVCPYCGTAFIVEKAINHYNMEHAEVNHVDHIEHVDNVTVDLKGSFDSVLGFASEQMKESRKMKAEMLNEQAARSLNRDKFMFKATDTDFPLLLCIFLQKMAVPSRFPEKDTVQDRLYSGSSVRNGCARTSQRSCSDVRGA